LKSAHRIVVFLTILLLAPSAIFAQGEKTRPPLRLQIKEIPLGKVLIEGNEYYSKAFLQRYFGLISGDASLKQKKLEKTLRLINEFPDLYVNAILIPKKELISTDLLLEVYDERPVHLTLEANNFGTKFTGETLLTTVLTWGDLTGHGDSAMIQTVYVPTAVVDVPMWQIGYTVPLISLGAKIDFSYMASHFVVDQEFTPLNIQGESKVYAVNFIYPITRESDWSWDFLSGMKAASVRSFAANEEQFQDEVRTIFIGTYWKRRLNAKNTISIGSRFTQGLGDSLSGSAGNEAGKLNFNLAENILINERLSFLLKTAFQLSSRPLLVSEQFGIGGADSVRGFTQGTSVGDNGTVINGEVQTPLYAQETLRIVGVAFVDYGNVFLRSPQPGQSSISLTGAGVGIRAKWNTLFSGRVDLGIPLSPNKNTDDDKAVVSVSVAMRF
jgi:hemolysin activation/secretion protein